MRSCVCFKEAEDLIGHYVFTFVCTFVVFLGIIVVALVHVRIAVCAIADFRSLNYKQN